MQRTSVRSRPRQRFLITLVLALAATLAGSPVEEDPIDDALRAITCSELVGTVTDELADPGVLIDPSYCHSQSDATVCAAGETCRVAGEDTAADGTVSAEVTGVGGTGGPMFLAVGKTQRTEACGMPSYVGVSTRFESEGVEELVATHRISKAIDQTKTQNGADNIHVCYESPKPFVDIDGQMTLAGVLPHCEDNGGVAPCVLHKLKNKADAIVKIKLPPGDPTWQMVEDTLDRYVR